MTFMSDLGNQVRALASQGWDVRLIAAELRIAQPEVREALATTTQRNVERGRDEQARWLHDQGWSVRRIERELGMSSEFVLRALQPSIKSSSSNRSRS